MKCLKKEHKIKPQEGGKVDSKGLYLLHQGEPVINIAQTKDKALHIHIDCSEISDEEWETLKKKIAKIIARAINES